MAKKTEKEPQKELTLIEKLQSKFPPGITATSVENVTSVYGIRRPFGIPSIDMSLGGGIPAGTVVQLIGEDGVGKDYLANRQIAQIQKNYGSRANVFIASFGYPVDKSALLLAGVHLPYSDDIAKMGISKNHPKYAPQFEPVGNIVLLESHKVEAKSEDDVRPAESVIGAVLACIESGEFQMGILNELPAGRTTWHARALPGDNSRTAALASLMADFQRYYYDAMKAVPGNETSLFILNQLRANVQMGRSNPNAPKTQQSGGWALRYLKAIDMDLRVCGKVEAKGEIIGKKVAWSLRKGKCGLSEGANGEYDFIFNEGADIPGDLIYVCQQLDMVVQKGSWFYTKGPDGEEIKAQGLDNFKVLVSQPLVYKYLMEQAYQAAGLTSVIVTSPERTPNG